MMKNKLLKIETVHQCNCCLGSKTLHPLVSVIDLSEAKLMQSIIKFDFYTILLLESQSENFIYGRQNYDYSNGTMVFLTPGQSINMEEDSVLPQKGWILAFHPKLICGTSLGQNIKNYTFFSYHPNEALQLSIREKQKVLECLNNIRQELQHAIDLYSKTLISHYIELLLDYCSRFYERQFITRCEANNRVVRQTNVFLDDYIQSGKLKNGVLPSDEYCADILQLSPHYFRDLLKFETGKSIYECSQEKRLEASMKMLLDANTSVSRIADLLGYPNVQYFSWLFKKITGVAPNEYRLAQN